MEEVRRQITTSSPASEYVTAGAVRLFLAGYLAKMRFNTEEDGHVYYNVPSETEPGVLYQIDYCPQRGTVRCSCKAGQFDRLCKHVRLLGLRSGWNLSEEFR